MRKHLRPILAIAVVTVTLFSCKNEKNNQNGDKDLAKNDDHGLDIEYMDTTVSPKHDFYNYVNGTWMKNTEIPGDHKSWGSFNLLRKNTDHDVLKMLEDAKKEQSFKKGSDRAKAIDLYQANLDTAARNKTGLKPLKPVMKKIDKVSSLKDLQKLMAQYPVQVANPFFGLQASALPENSKMNGLYLYPGGLGLPDRDYYTADDSKSKEIRKQYVKHIARMFKMWGEDQDAAHKKAKNILALETKLAQPRLTKEERRHPSKLNNPRSIKEISKMTPAIDWKQWIDDLPVEKDIDTMIVTQLKYMKSLQKILSSEDIQSLKNLVSWQTLNGAAGDLTTDMEKANWDFYSKTLNGTPEQRPANERAVSIVNGNLGEALGKIYVDKKFPPKAKKTAETMVHNIIEVYKNRIHDLEWMTDTTKQKAIKKLNSLTIKIGYPDEWKDYSNMDISKDNSYYDNLVASSKWHHNYNLSKINEPVDTIEWGMNPQTVNAYYNPSANEIVFPAAILQPPFFDYKADAAVNFGGMGAVIGHEISHAFDDQGAQYDAEGNLHNWWTKEDLKKFKKRTQKLSDFYSKIQAADSLHLNGDYTLGENTADLGGVLASYNALQRYYKTHDRPGKIDGFTQNQRFFLSWATVWRTKVRPAALRTQIKTDPHSPGLYRAYLPLQNVDAFYDAFDIQKGDSMFVAPKDRVRIW